VRPVAPAVSYASNGDLSIAYRVVGDGPVDLVWVPGFVSHVEILWELPMWRRLMDRLTSFARVIVFDKREQGLSDRTGAPPTLEFEHRGEHELPGVPGSWRLFSARV
jgi:hypothetical protein